MQNREMAEIEDEQCDLETLAAILDDDDDNDDGNTGDDAPNTPHPPATDGDEELCFSDSDEEAGLGALASIMEQENLQPLNKGIYSDAKDKNNKSRNNSPKDVKPCADALKLPSPSQSPQNTETARLQEELRKMQEQMLRLQQQVLQSQQAQDALHTFSEALTKGDKCSQSKQFPNNTTKQKGSSESKNSPFGGTETESVAEYVGERNSTGKKSSVDNNDVFFPDSDSDWEDMEGEKNTTLSEEGKELKKLLGGKQKRTAHSTSYSPSVFKKQLPEAKWKIKSKDVVAKAEQPKATAVSLESKFMTESDDVMVFAGIRIINPKVSSELLRIKMDGRKVIKMSRLSFKMNTTDLEGNWVTFGVIVHKSETRKSSNGNNYSIWKLSDLEDTDKTMTFFLFKDVYKQHWKCQQGTVLGLLNPNLMQKAEKSENSFTIDHPGQMLIIGQSKDLGICKGTTKTGKMCTNFINKKQSEYCTYHVQSVYKRTSAKRNDLQSGFTGVVPKSFSKKIIPTGSHVFYGGQTFSTLPSSGKATTKKGVNLQQLQRHNSSSSKGKVTTLTLHELAPVKDDKGMGTEMIKEQPFLDFLSTPTVGSLNLVKHLIKKENASEKQSGKVQVVSISPGELLKQHKQQANRLKQRCTKQSGGLTSGPQLGRGLKPGQDIVFGSSPQERPYIHKDTPRPMRPKNTELAKSSDASVTCVSAPGSIPAVTQTQRLTRVDEKQAIAKVLAKGGISKEDPNAVRKSKTSPQSENRVRKRVADHLEAESPERIEEPVQKRSRYLGNVDLNSEAIQGLLKAKSSHAGALAQLEAERHEKYFTELEKKEKCEQQMLDITQIKCTAYTCQQCKYTALSISDLCKAEGHKVNQIKGMKRFFKCQDCNTRTMTLHRYPTLPCRSCKGKSFIKTSMWKEKEGPKLESEILHVTGDTQKFLDSQIK